VGKKCSTEGITPPPPPSGEAGPPPCDSGYLHRGPAGEGEEEEEEEEEGGGRGRVVRHAELPILKI
jgi:hypothetical protein